MIRVFLDDKPLDLPEEHPALPQDSFDTEAEAKAWIVECDAADPRCWGQIQREVDDGEAWILLDGAPRLVQIESWQDAARRLAAERDEAKGEAAAAMRHAALVTHALHLTTRALSTALRSPSEMLAQTIDDAAAALERVSGDMRLDVRAVCARLANSEEAT